MPIDNPKVRKHPLAVCEQCPLFSADVAPTTGPADATIAVVSRSPGKYEAMNGKPFSGPSGKVLDYLLLTNGVKREKVITTNVVLCTSDEPPAQAIACCSARLESEIAGATTIVAAGKEAAEYLVKARSIHSSRGYEHHRTSSNGRTQRVVVTTNPAVVLRDASNFPDMVKDFRLALNPRPAPRFPNVSIIDDIKTAGRYLESILGNSVRAENRTIPTVATDIEWRGGFSPKTRVTCIGFSTDGLSATVLTESVCHDEGFLRMGLERFLANRNVSFIWHNGKADCKVLRRQGLSARVDHDTMLLSYALDERPVVEGTGGVHSLEYLLMDEFGWPDYEPESVKHFKKTGEMTNPEELYTYNGWDAAGTKQLFDILVPRCKEDNVY